MWKRKRLRNLLLCIAAELVIIACIVCFFDVFYQYHAPFLGMKAVFNDVDNQVPGSIRSFPYDSVLIGSSVAQNFDAEYLDEVYGCTTLKVIKPGAVLQDHIYHANMAANSHSLKNVFWCLDLFALDQGSEVTLFMQGASEYLYTDTVFDDVEYIFNKEILLEKIPAWIVSSRQEIYTGKDAYNWSKDKNFGTDYVLAHYGRYYQTGDAIIELDPQEYRETVDFNIQSLVSFVKNHPDTEFYFLLPPYSMLWWDDSYVTGQSDMRFYELKEIFQSLVGLENAKVYFFMNHAEIVLNLDNYMDTIHYSPYVNQYMLECMGKGMNEVTEENALDLMEDMRRLIERIETEEIGKYYK